MLIAFLTNLRAVDPQSSSDAATDSLLDGYVAWREACADVSATYECWIRSLRREANTLRESLAQIGRPEPRPLVVWLEVPRDALLRRLAPQTSARGPS